MNRRISLININPYLYLFCFLLLTDISIVLNLPVLRQILGALFLLFLPGAIILQILNLNRLMLSEKFVLSVGLSISFSLFFGLLINELYPIIGFNRPLSTISIMLSFNIILISLMVVTYIRNPICTIPNFNDILPDKLEKLILLLPLCFPPLSLLAIQYINIYGNNELIFVLFTLILLYIIAISCSHKHIPIRVFPIIILLISLSITLLYSTRTNYIIGSDSHIEYYIFYSTFGHEKWSRISEGILDASLSISLLPCLFNSILNIQGEFFFKIIYSSIFSISSIIIFIMARKYLDPIYAFFSAFYFMSQIVFIQAAANARTVMAILFFALSIMVLFHKDINDLNKKLLFQIFFISCVLSHYSTTYIFFSVISFTVLASYIYSISPLTKSLAIGRKIGNATFNMSIILLTFIIIFCWYSQLTEVPFSAGIKFLSTTINSLNQFFIEESRGEGAAAIGYGLSTKAIPKRIHFAFAWITIILTIYGSLIPLKGFFKKSLVAFKDIDIDMLYLAIACLSFSALSLLLPHVFQGYGIDRLYMQISVVLSIFFSIGCLAVNRTVGFKKPFVIVAILIPYFMCTSGFMYQILGDDSSIIFNSKGPYVLYGLVHDQESSCAKWIKLHVNNDDRIYTNGAYRKLVSQGMIPESRFIHLANRIEFDSYIYLSLQDTITILKKDYVNKIYDNNYSTLACNGGILTK